MAAKALLKMMKRSGAVADVRQHRAQTLMRLRVIRINPQHRLVMLAGFRVLVGAKQQIGEIHARHRIVRMVKDRLRIDAAGSVNGSHIRQQGPEFVEGAEMGRRSAQNVDEGPLGVLPPVESAQENRAFDFGADRVGLHRLARQHILELS